MLFCYIVFFFLIGSSYGVFLVSFSRKSNYSLLAGRRAVLVLLRYEVFLFILISFVLTKKGGAPFITLFTIGGGVLYFLGIMNELGRLPFDFVEGERELIRGFSIERGGVLFIFVTLGEYTIITVQCLVFSHIFSPGFFFPLLFLVLLARSRLPRVRYDHLIGLCWKKLFPFRVLLSVCNI